MPLSHGNMVVSYYLVDIIDGWMDGSALPGAGTSMFMFTLLTLLSYEHQAWLASMVKGTRYITSRLTDSDKVRSRLRVGYWRLVRNDVKSSYRVPFNPLHLNTNLIQDQPKTRSTNYDYCRRWMASAMMFWMLNRCYANDDHQFERALPLMRVCTAWWNGTTKQRSPLGTSKVGRHQFYVCVCHESLLTMPPTAKTSLVNIIRIGLTPAIKTKPNGSYPTKKKKKI